MDSLSYILEDANSPFNQTLNPNEKETVKNNYSIIKSPSGSVRFRLLDSHGIPVAGIHFVQYNGNNHISGIYTDPDYRRKGFASLVISQAKKTFGDFVDPDNKEPLGVLFFNYLEDPVKTEKLKDAFGTSLDIIHTTSSLSTAKSIVEDGFKLSKFGQSAKINGMQNLIKFDPVGIYSRYEQNSYIVPKTPYVKFQISPEANVIRSHGSSNDFKRKLFGKLGAISNKDFTDKLRALGVDAIIPTDLSDEIIVVNKSCIKAIEAGLYQDSTIEINGRSLSR